MLRLAGLIALLFLLAGCDQIGIGNGIFGNDQYGVYRSDAGDCWVQGTTEQPLLGKRIPGSDTWPDRNQAQAAGCVYVRRGQCNSLKNGTVVVQCN
jgi:hypothetical protein